MRILVVDNHIEGVSMISDILSGHDIDGKIVCEYNSKYDLAIIDYKHIEFVNFKIPTIIMSARGNIETEIDALENGAIRFISKPISPPLLKTYVELAKPKHWWKF